MSEPTTTSPSTDSSFVTFLKQRWPAILLVVVFAIFIASNTKDVDVKFLVWTLTGPLWLTLLITFVAGALAGWVGLRRRNRRKAGDL